MATHKCQQSNSKRPLPAYARPIKSASLSKRFNTYGASKKAVPLHKEEIEDDDLCCSFGVTHARLKRSASCRKKDGDKQFVLPLDPLLTPFSQSSNFSCVFYSREIVPPRSPTQPRSNRASCGFPELSSNDDAASGDKKTSQNSDASRY
ncbi:hypothetical protein PMIN01_08217 [Paraphaeosphaeria minitans]|uniref:Uncharacterized protein n=1 Tax=Paraphaeosphaeria minitans TaxID=565426 RepID=A0A9P6GEE3_9PLEO|nr:hypothetical protein PMIN01_08217 [Paraphaeosphaeria minitans]